MEKPTFTFHLLNVAMKHNFLEVIILGSVPVVVASQEMLLFGYL